MDFYNKNVLVCGIARSGISAAILLKDIGANVTIQDIKRYEDIEDINEIKFIEKKGINLYLGKNPEKHLIDKMDIMVVSPGLPLNLDFVQYSFSKIPVISEIELAYLNCKSPIIAITGTNGKTTTTSIMGEILKNYKNTYIVGNIGIPFSEEVIKINKDDVAVIELSSFQLETIYKFKPNIACVLNITPDHLNRHKTMENYVLAKEKIFKNQNENDFLILNYDDIHCRNMASKTKSNIMYFSINQKIMRGAYLEDNYIYINNEKFIDTNMINIIGKHNMENVMASILMSLAFNVPLDIIKKGLMNFCSIEHRIEYVLTKNNVDYYNDSKATNIDATIKAIDAMKKPIYLISGGSEKNSNFIPMIEAFGNKVKHLIIIGEVKNRIAKDCKNLGFLRYTIKDTLLDAVKFCYESAKDGDCVLLSPACASFDMFKDYEERGKLFKEYVKKLKE